MWNSQPVRKRNYLRFESKLVIVFILALGLRLGFLIFFHYLSLYRGMGGFYPLQSDSDDVYYFSEASYMSSLSFLEILRYPVLAPGFAKLIAFVFKLFGNSLLIGKVFNAFLGAVTVCLVYRMAKTLNPKNAFLIASLCAFYPAFLFYSTQLLKDMLFCLIFLLAVYLALLVFRSEKSLHVYIFLFLFFMCVTYLYFIRNYAAVLLAFSFFLSLLILDFRKFIYSLPFWIAGALVIFVGFPSFVDNVSTVIRDPERIAAIRAVGYSHGGSAYGIRFGKDMITNLYGYFLSFLYLLVGPLPWHVRSLTHLLALPESFLLMILGVPVLLGFGDAILNRKRENLFLLLTAFLYLAFVASFSDNAGANTRLRMVGVILVLIVSRFEVFGKQLALPRLKSRDLQKTTTLKRLEE